MVVVYYKMLIRTSQEGNKLDTVKKILIANRNGFTLIELMSVLVIMGILVSVLYKPAEKKASQAT